ncbi:MAG: FKBP-type peptidyl-prolyl cis-trans isomerase [Clostridia bacterium]|nr:FKBP-type peptidyl-prolyl cis-trans isomerase [Clostridia bacterium]
MKKTFSILLALLIAAFALASCSTEGQSNVVTDPVTGQKIDYDLTNYSDSDGLDVNGFFKDITALDYVTLPEYKGVRISAEVLEANEADVEEQIAGILDEYTTYDEITDRAVEDGDTVNIDYVGSVDGVEFDGGSTGGMGTEVTIGVTNYIDDFLEQLIGHMPGDRFNVYVTFPVTYGVDSLNGKDAVFDVTVNYICGDRIDAELTDEIAADYGFETVEDLKQDIRDWLVTQQKSDFFTELIYESELKNDVPQQVLSFVVKSDLSNYKYYADAYEVTLDEFMYSYLGYENTDVYIEYNMDSYRNNALYCLAIQAIAEKEGLTVTDMDVSDAGLSDYVESYGMPFLKQYVLQTITVPTFVTDNAIVE